MKRSASAQSGSSPGSRATSSIESPSCSARERAAAAAAGSSSVLVPGERVLELVVGESLRLLVVALCDEVEVRLSVLVARELLFHDLPADRLSVLDGRQRVAEPRCVGPEAPEGSDSSRPAGWRRRSR